MENLHEVLKKHVVSVVFNKSNGEERTMKCTLIPAVVEEVNSTGVYSESEYDSSKDIEYVVDIEIGQWRAFKPSRVKFWKVL